MITDNLWAAWRTLAAYGKTKRWAWSDVREPDAWSLEQGITQPYVSECACLGDTIVQKAGDWEDQREDCAYITAACTAFPVLLNEVEALRNRVLELEGVVSSV